jgi:ligand-binding sensor domain-containing protein
LKPNNTIQQHKPTGQNRSTLPTASCLRHPTSYILHPKSSILPPATAYCQLPLHPASCRCLLTLLLFFLCLLTSAQYYAFKKYTIRDGIPQSQVLQVTEDPQGYIWASTKDGVTRFDGLHFTNYFEKDGIGRDLYYTITPDTQGNVYFFGIKSYYRHSGKRFVPITKPALYPNTEFQFTQAGNTFYGTPVHQKKGNMVYTIRHDSIVPAFTLPFDTNTYNFTNYTRYDTATQLLWLRLCTFTQPYQTKLLACNTQGRVVYQGNVVNNSINFIYATRKGVFWVDIPQRNIYRLTDKPLLWGKLPADFTGHVKDMDFDIFGNLFLANNQSLYMVQPNGLSAKFSERFTLINYIYSDNHGQLWVADEGALYKFHHFAFTHFGEQHGITKNIWSVVEDKTGGYWMGGFGSGLHYYNGSGFTNYTRLPFLPQYNNTQTFDNIYMGALRDWRGRVLIPNSHWVTAIKNHQPTHYYTGQHSLYLLADSTEKRIYTCGTSGVVILNEQLKVVDSIPKGKLFAGNVLFAMNATINAQGQRQQCKWFGNNRFIATITNGRIDTGFYNQYGKPVGGLCMAQDGSGNIWLGNHDGLTLFNGKKFLLYNQPPFNRAVGTLLQYNDTTLYAGLHDGFAIINTTATQRSGKLVFRTFNQHNGFVGIESGQNGLYKDTKGNVWLPTTDLVTCINPRLLPPENNTYRTRIDGAFTQDENYNWQLHQSANNLLYDTLLKELPYNHRRVKITFGAIHHTAPENTRFIYRLAGFDTKWSAPTQSMEAVYTHLPPGNYTFIVRAGQGKTFLRHNQATLHFSIYTPLWQRPWVIFTMLYLGIILMAVVTYCVVTYLRQKRDAEVKLQLELNNLQYMALKTQIEPHFASNLLNSVNAAILHEDKKQASKILGRFAGFIREILKANDAQTHPLQQELDFIQHYIELEKINLKDKLQYTLQTTGSVNLQQPVPVMLLHTFIENAVKHAIKQNPTGGAVQLHLQQQPKQLLITITDTGAGHTASNAFSHLPPTRKGIALIEKIIALYNVNNHHKCTLHITDTPTGRSVQIHIPNGYKF